TKTLRHRGAPAAFGGRRTPFARYPLRALRVLRSNGFLCASVPLSFWSSSCAFVSFVPSWLQFQPSISFHRHAFAIIVWSNLRGSRETMGRDPRRRVRVPPAVRSVQRVLLRRRNPDLPARAPVSRDEPVAAVRAGCRVDAKRDPRRAAGSPGGRAAQNCAGPRGPVRRAEPLVADGPGLAGVVHLRTAPACAPLVDLGVVPHDSLDAPVLDPRDQPVVRIAGCSRVLPGLLRNGTCLQSAT